MGAHAAPALLAAVFVLAGGARLANADEPTSPSQDASADAAPEVAPIPAPAAAVVPSALAELTR